MLFVQRMVELHLQYRELDEALAVCEQAMIIAPKNEKIRQLQAEITAAQRASTS